MRISDWSSDVCSSDLDEPLSTFCAAGNHHGEVRACFVKYYSEGSQYQAANEPLDTLTTKPRFAIVQVPVEELGLTEEQRFEAWWIARFLEMYGTKDQGNPLTEHLRSDEHTSELQSLMRISYAVFCLKQKTQETNTTI